jgi:hypothetical protein
MDKAMTTPVITVLLPVYNGAAEVVRAVDTVLNQTFGDFELLIINDGSRDDSAAVLDGMCDPRIRVVHQANAGLAATLNRGIALAQGRYVVRQDQDDWCRPSRLEKQLAYMEAHPDCGLLGTWAEIWVGDTPSERVHDHPVTHGLLSFDLLFNNPFVHSSVMLRKDVLQAVGGYSTDPARQPPEDYELWSRMARQCTVANLPERLLVYREMPQSMSRTGDNPFQDKLVTLCAENLAFANRLRVPNAACIDAAAFTHSALHRLSPRPSMRRMLQVVQGAGERIAADSGEPEVLRKTEERIAILRYQFMLRQTHAHWVRPLLRPLRNLFNKFRSR